MNSGAEVIDRKQRIRDRYRGVDTSELFHMMDIKWCEKNCSLTSGTRQL